MSTQTQILANRLNAQKSTGPNTPQGKAVVSQNALKHGLSALRDVIITESQADFDLHRDALLAELAPQGPMESILAGRIVSLSWRLKRAELIQNQTFDAMYEKITSDPLANLAKSFGLKGLGNPKPETSDPPPDLTLGRIAVKDFSNSRVLDRLLMYERRIEHSLYKTTLELQRLRPLRTLEHPAHAGIPIHQDPIINNQSSIVNIDSTPEPAAADPTRPDTPVAERTENQESSVEYQESSIENQKSGIIAQNKPNFKMGKMNIKTATVKAYANEQPTMNSEHYPKQTQSNPKLSPQGRNPALSGVEGTRYEPCTTAAERP